MVYLFKQIEERLEFAQATNTPIPGEKVINIAYLPILRTGEMEKACEQWGDMQVWEKILQALKYNFAQAYRHW